MKELGPIIQAVEREFGLPLEYELEKAKN